tara:strand:+ start:338 stop:1423 length:1086 start_codon:yes stop_codon:yes gene_type:complete
MKEKKVYIVLFGIGNVGGTLISQLQKAKEKIKKVQGLDINIQIVANSRDALFQEIGDVEDWQAEFGKNAVPYSIDEIIQYTKQKGFTNLIAVDATASKQFVQNYTQLIEGGFHIASANKVANTLEYEFYNQLREILKENNKDFKYEANVGAGLPIIDTIKNLHDSGENITRIRGVFSGSLSFIFNEFSTSEKNFSEVLKQAIDNGYTEPDPREDLNGNDVARKLLILARELDLKNEFQDIEIQNLIPASLLDVTKSEFLDSTSKLDADFLKQKFNQEQDYVLRYVGDLYGDLFQEKGQMKVSLVSVPKNSSLGSLKGSDAMIEIFTESYGEQPIVIQGAGAGAEVTARGVFGDVLKLSKSN